MHICGHEHVVISAYLVAIINEDFPRDEADSCMNTDGARCVVAAKGIGDTSPLFCKGRPKVFSFSFSAPKTIIFDDFGHFRLRPKMSVSYRLAPFLFPVKYETPSSGGLNFFHRE